MLRRHDYERLSSETTASSYKLDVSLEIPYGSHVGGAMQGLQSYIIEHVERYTGIIIKELNIVIDTVEDRRGS